MAKRSKPRDFILGVLSFIALLPFLIAQWIRETVGIPVPITLTVFGALVVWLVVTYIGQQRERIRAVQIANVDAMPGIEFERYLQTLLTAQGYGVQLTR